MTEWGAGKTIFLRGVLFMADEQPIKLVQIGPKGGAKKDGFNLVTERVIAFVREQVR